MYRKKYEEFNDRVKFLEEDIENLEIKRREAELLVKRKDEELKV